MTAETPAALAARVERAIAARRPDRPLRRTAEALAFAAARWRHDPLLACELPARAALSPAMVAATLPLVAAALDAEAMADLAHRELDGRTFAPPTLVAHVLASNVPALALPAIALACLVGAAVVVKSGRSDPISAVAFQRALAAVDPELAATVVPAYWPGGDAAMEAAAFARADLVVVSGSDATLAALGARVERRLVRHGTRVSAAVIAGSDAALQAPAVARDVALYDQRGCLSPHVVYVAGDAPNFAAALGAALDALAAELPPGPAPVAERAAAGSRRAEAEWEGAAVRGGAGGVVILDDGPAFRPSPGRRTVRVQPIGDAVDALRLLPAGLVECVGTAGVSLDADTLRALGVSRCCPAGRMQAPPLAWPRGQHAPLRSLVGLESEPAILVET